MEQIYKRRLLKLAKHMASFDAERNAKHFRMRTFLEHRDNELTPQQVILQHVLSDCYCETVACAVGHAPDLFPSLMKKFNKECGEYVDHYTGRYDADHEPIYEKRWSDPGYAQLSKFLFNVQINTREFEFLFGGDWDSGRYHSYQSTSWAVADRILFYIDNEDRVEAFGRWQNWEVAERMATRVGMIDEDWLADQMTALESLSPTVYDREYGECDA